MADPTPKTPACPECGRPLLDCSPRGPHGPRPVYVCARSAGGCGFTSEGCLVPTAAELDEQWAMPAVEPRPR